MNIETLQKDLKKLLDNTHTTHGYICQLYISSAINPFFICAGYDLSDALENALELDILKDYTTEELAANITLIEEVRA